MTQPNAPLKDFPRLLLTQAEVCQIIGVSRSTLWRMTKSGELRTIPVSKRAVRIPYAELERWVARKIANEAAQGGLSA